MNKQMNIIIPSGKYTPSGNSEMKIYHKPQLTEWGTLQEVTRGGKGAVFDSHSFAASDVHGRPPAKNRL